MTDAPHPETPIEALLKERIGLDAASIGTAVVMRAVQERQLAVGARDAASYWNLLHAVPDELQALIEAVVVPETWFFRHREALLALGRFAAQRVFGDGVRLLRVASVPCSTGEEPYSIAMALLDAGIPPDRFRVDAIDVSARALERARAGHYGNNAFRGRPLDFRDRYFTQEGTGFAIAAKVREQVRLVRGNLVDPLLLANEPPYHFVFCRNLLIYFDPDTQRRAVRTLVRLTMPDGLVFVGPAEASLLTRDGLPGAGVPLAFAFHPRAVATPVPAGTTLPPLSPPPSASRQQPVHPAAAMPTRMAGSATARLRPPQPSPAWTSPPAHTSSSPALQPSPASPASSRLPVSPTSPASRAAVQLDGLRPQPPAAAAAVATAAHDNALAAIASQADRGELDAATAACLDHVATRGPSASAFCLLGVLYDAAGRAADAHAAYRKAVYLDPGHEEALYHLAALLDSEGDAAGAGRLRQRAQRHARLNHG